MFPFMSKSKYNSVDVNELEKLLGNINLIDIREPYEFRAGHLPSAKNIPMDEVLDDTDKFLDKSKEYHIVCHSGSRSSMACGILKDKGYNIINVAGGTGRYRGKLER